MQLFQKISMPLPWWDFCFELPNPRKFQRGLHFPLKILPFETTTPRGPILSTGGHARIDGCRYFLELTNILYRIE